MRDEHPSSAFYLAIVIIALIFFSNRIFRAPRFAPPEPRKTN
jgi:hypothetical protein